ncbi:MAG: lipoprotein [Sinimarinibacterium sp.]|jgi:predicted small lipoprotein YifL
MLRLRLILVSALLLAACGQAGPLYLPERTAAPPSPTPAPTFQP